MRRTRSGQEDEGRSNPQGPYTTVVFPRHETKRRESRSRHLDGGLEHYVAKSQHPNNNPTNRQQNHTSRTHLIKIYHPTGLGSPPVADSGSRERVIRLGRRRSRRRNRTQFDLRDPTPTSKVPCRGAGYPLLHNMQPSCMIMQSMVGLDAGTRGRDWHTRPAIVDTRTLTHTHDRRARWLAARPRLGGGAWV